MVVGVHAHVIQPRRLMRASRSSTRSATSATAGTATRRTRTASCSGRSSCAARRAVSLGGRRSSPAHQHDGRTNDFCPTPYEADSAEYARVIKKLGLSENGIKKTDVRERPGVRFFSVIVGFTPRAMLFCARAARGAGEDSEKQKGASLFRFFLLRYGVKYGF
jgi:hypothetical protein